MNFPFVKLYENVIPPDICNKIIREFEDSPDERIKTDIDGYIKFEELNVTHFPRWGNFVNIILDTCIYHRDLYKQEFKIDSLQFPEKFGFEEIRIKRYLPNDYDEFKLHVDVNDYKSARRYLSYLFYLNDVEEGGETSFGRNRDLVIKPKQGSLLIFPPLWTYIHTGHKPISGNKYIVSTYNVYP